MMVGFTGTQRGMTQLQKDRLPALLYRLRLTEARHGDCIGADAEFHEIVRDAFPAAKIHGHPGPGPKRAHCDFDTCAEPKEYLKRNMDIVQFSDCLVATPHGPEIQRSGTWSTVRYAKNQVGRVVFVIWPDGDVNCYFDIEN